MKRLLCFVLALSFAACGDDGADRQAVVDWIVDKGETPGAAACYADEIKDFGIEDLEALEASESEEEADPKLIAALDEAADVCRDK